VFSFLLNYTQLLSSIPAIHTVIMIAIPVIAPLTIPAHCYTISQPNQYDLTPLPTVTHCSQTQVEEYSYYRYLHFLIPSPSPPKYHHS